MQMKKQRIYYVYVPLTLLSQWVKRKRKKMIIISLLRSIQLMYEIGTDIRRMSVQLM